MNGSSQPILRFAPSPNGPLHLGHAYSALFTAATTGRLGGRFLLRIEDIDTARCRPEFVAAIFDDLGWLGLQWEEPVRIQSAHFDAYRTAAESLRAMGLLYPCFCSRTEIAAAAGEATDPDRAPLYPGTCRHRSEAERARRIAANEPHAWRIDIATATARTGPLQWRELHENIGPETVLDASPERWGDAVIVRKDTPSSYHLSVVVDDAIQGITHVTRGRDLFEATAIHRVLQTLLGLPEPVYSHHSLILDPDMRKLAKSAGSTALADLRAAGITPEEIRRRLELGDPA